MVRAVLALLLCLLATPRIADADAGQGRVVLPVTIEALKPIVVRTNANDRRLRGVLFVAGRPGLKMDIKKGQRFSMTKLLGDGGCTIMIKKAEYDAPSCPWLDGFTDHEREFFKVVPQRRRR